MLKVSELAKEVRMTDDTIRYAIASGELPGYKFGNEWRIKRNHADAWIEKHRVTGEAERKPVSSARGATDPYALGKVAS